MRLVDRHLLVFFGVLALAGVAIVLSRRDAEPRGGAPIHAPPPRADGWVTIEGAPEDVLPSDPRALAAIRRTYSSGRRTVWLTVARYHSGNHPLGRPSLNRMVPERGAMSVTRDLLRVDLDGRPGRSTLVNVISLRHPERQLSVIYWYQLGQTTIADEYHLRLRLFWETLLFRRRALWLVRIATAESEWSEGFLQTIYRQLTNTLSS